MHKGPLIATLSLASGIAMSAIFGLSWWCGVMPIAISLIVYLFILRSLKNPVIAFRIGKWHVMWVVMLFVGIGLTDESLNRPETLDIAFGRNLPDSLCCEVTSVLTKTYGDRIDAVIEGTNGAKVRIRSGITQISPGDVIKIQSCCLKEISSDTTEIGRRIKPMLRASGILYTGRITPAGLDVVGRSSNLRYFFTDIRETIEANIERSHLSKSTADFLKAIMMGDKTGLDEQTRMTFANGGMAHMLALSGLHIGILAGFLILVMWPIRLVGHYKWGYVIALCFLWVYVALTGMFYSSVRACIMTTFAFIGIIAERKNFAGNALCSACMLILLVDPAALFDAGFQLSVVCVGALIAFASRLNPIGHRHHPVLYNLSGALIATMVATFASWVLISYYFSQIPLMFLTSNFILLPLLPLYLSLAVVFVVFLSLGYEMRWIGRILDDGYDLILYGTERLSCGTEFVVDYQVPLWGVITWLLMLAGAALVLHVKETK